MELEENITKKILLISPDFPLPTKRKIHHDYLPIGLLKIGTYFRGCMGYHVKLQFGCAEQDFYPDEIWVTSLFTYWSEYVHETIKFYKDLYPNSSFFLGGIYASLQPERARQLTGVEIQTGLHKEAEEWCKRNPVDYSLMESEVNFQILHGMRGCFRRCKFCGTWKIEPYEEFDNDIAKRVKKNHVVFYDNNFLRNPNIKRILIDLANVKPGGKRVTYESQSGFDGRILDQETANLLKMARFVNPRIAWDNSYDDVNYIKKQIDFLVNAGYKSKDITIFILYNWEYDFSEVERKRIQCWEWGVQISDCRYRPIDQYHDYYDGKKTQTDSDYFIHENWSDMEVKQFRRNVRKHNICIRHGFSFYSSKLERMRVSKEESMIYRKMDRNSAKAILSDVWYPDESNPP